MLALRSRWWPSWSSPSPNRKASKPPAGTVNNMDGTGKPKLFSVWGMKVDTSSVRSTVPAAQHIALGWDSNVIALKSLARARDMSLAANVAAMVLSAVQENKLFLPILGNCLDQDWKALFTMPTGTVATGSRRTAGLAGQAATGAPATAPDLPGADANEADCETARALRDAAARAVGDTTARSASSGGVFWVLIRFLRAF